MFGQAGGAINGICGFDLSATATATAVVVEEISRVFSVTGADA